MDRLQIGFVTGAGREEVAALEALPIDSLWVGGHVSAPNPTPEAMVQLARLSALTERVRIGTSILLLPLYPPALVAKQVAELDRASGGRVSLGVGVGGEYAQEFRACGVPVKERGRRTDESIALIRRLWSGEQISHSGPFYPMEDVRIHPAPTQAGGPHHRRPQGPGDGAGRSAGRRLVPLPLLAARLCGVHAADPGGRAGGGA